MAGGSLEIHTITEIECLMDQSESMADEMILEEQLLPLCREKDKEED